MRVGVDAMGGDLGPAVIIRGALAGLQHLGEDDGLLLFGPQDVVSQHCAEIGIDDPRVQIVHCSEVIGMEDPPVEAIRQKRDSSIAKMAGAAAEGHADVIISAGNTGAFAAACQFKIKTMPGVSRPGIGVVIPTFFGPVILCDAGANVAPKPHHLYEYALMGKCYSQIVLGKENPRVGLASIGEEAGKGNQLIREAGQLIQDDPTLDFVGNVEGRDLFGGRCDVFVSDGFTGNIVLKLTEGLSEQLFRTIFREIREECPHLEDQFKPICDRIWARHDFKEYGGAPLLGINKIAIICHGRSDETAISNAIKVGRAQHEARLIETIRERLMPTEEEAT